MSFKVTGKPIGIFDSGIGGLTVASAISKVLPSEQITYFGDTAHLPYGDKSSDSIKYYSIRIAQFLQRQHCKIIVIACNTASSVAYEVVRDFTGKEMPVVNVIDPVVQSVIDAGHSKKIGVIGTKGTIRSGVYEKKLKQLNPALEVVSLATPLLAPMIEEGFFNNKISRSILNDYLNRPKLKKIDTLILGCTHYPLVKEEIKSIFGNRFRIIDSAQIVGEYIATLLKKKNLLQPNKSLKPKHRFYVSDYTDTFEKSTQYFFKGKIKLEKMEIWK